MKPTRLTFDGLRTFTSPVEVDFMHLCEDGLFAIVGPTGAGKSTILDAIFIALFGTAPREKGKDFVNFGVDKAYVELDFETRRDGVVEGWRVRREFRRKRVRGSSETAADVTAGNVWLYRTEAGLVLMADKVTALDQVIREDALGLDPDSFQRAVILPQGAFDKLLRAGPTGRAELIGRIFDLDRFGEALSKRVAEWRSPLLAREAELKTLLGATPATPELLGVLTTMLEQAEAEAATASAVSELATTTVVALEGSDRAYQRLLVAEVEVARLEAERPELDTLRQSLRAAESAEPVVPLIVQLSGAKDREAQQGRALVEAQERQASATTAHRDAINSWEAVEAERGTNGPARDALIARAREAKALGDQRQDELVMLQGHREELSRLEDALRRMAVESEAATGALAVVEVELDRLALELSSLRTAPDERGRLGRLLGLCNDAERALASRLSAESVHAAETERATAADLALAELVKGVEACSAARAAANADPRLLFDAQLEQASLTAKQTERLSLSRVDAELTELTEAVRQRRGETETTTASVGRAGEALRAAGVLRDELYTNVRRSRAREEELKAERDRLEVVAQGAALVHALHDGAPCPVCGALEHPAPAIATSELEQARAAHEAIVKQVDHEVSAQSSSDLTYNSAEKDQSHAMQLAAVATSRLDEAQTRLSRRQDEETSVFEGRLEAGARASLLGDRETELAALVLALDTSKVAFKVASSQRDVALAAFNLAESEAKVTRDRLVAARALERRAAELASEAVEPDQKARDAFEAAAEGQTRAEVHERAQDLVTRDVRCGDLEVRTVDVQSARQAASVACEAANRASIDAAEARGRCLAAGSSCEARCADLAARITERVPEGDPAVVLADALEEKDKLDAESVGRREASALATAELGRADEALPKQEELHRCRVSESKDSEEALLAALSTSGFEDATAARAAVMERASREKGAAKVGQWDRERSSAGGALEAARAVFQDASAVVDALGSTAAPTAEGIALAKVQSEAAKGALGEAQAAVGRAKTELESLKRTQTNHARYQASLDALRPTIIRADQLSSAFRGKALEAYFASRYLRAILKTASQHLLRLTRDQYELCLQDDELCVRDHFDAGVIRKVSSLSGGESFLASLALSVALSDHIQHRGRVQFDFFFLDEGFGALDPDTLEVALNALEQLRGNHRTIGTISHVAAMQDRMPRRLVVSKAPPGGTATVTHEPSL